MRPDGGWPDRNPGGGRRVESLWKEKSRRKGERVMENLGKPGHE